MSSRTKSTLPASLKSLMVMKKWNSTWIGQVMMIKSMPIPSRFGFNRFRVLTVTTSAERVKHLIEACHQLERGQGLFLFTDLASLLAHGDILTLPWQTCQPGKTETLT